jgi:hypothetical protein
MMIIFCMRKRRRREGKTASEGSSIWNRKGRHATRLDDLFLRITTARMQQDCQKSLILQFYDERT